jgi:phosphate transport system substrate-binding protein
MKKVCIIVLLGIAIASGCARQTQYQTITIAGSTSIQPFAEKLAEHYMQLHTQIRINVQGGGSTAGIQATKDGICDIGASSRQLKPDEEKLLKRIVIAKDGIAVILNPQNKIDNLSLEEIRDIFSGKIQNWAKVGGDEAKIIVITREEGSGTRDAFTKLVMKDAHIDPKALVQDSNGSVREVVATSPYAIGYISLGLVNERVKPIKVDNIIPDKENIITDKYKLARPFLFVTKGDIPQHVQEFIDFVLSKDGQRLLEEEGLIPVSVE